MKTTYPQAKALVMKGVKPLPPETIPLKEALGRLLIGRIRAPYDYPLRDVSAMDGFAYAYPSLREGYLRVRGMRRAGDRPGARVPKGCAVRIMTGAPLPPGTDTVTPKEQASLEKGRVVFHGELYRGSHVRRQGEGIRKGRVVRLPEGALSDRSLGFLATLGVGKLRARRLPRVAVLVTGNELLEPGRSPGSSGVFESNGLMLVSALKGMGLEARALRVKDRAALLTARVRRALAICDVLLVTGGVSVGESDATKEAFRRAGVRKVFWRVSQKPGGPFYFGRKGEKRIFGLPGNPAAVYSCFHFYVRPLLNGLLGKRAEPLLRFPLGHPVRPLRRKTLFAKAVQARGKVKALGGQGSHLLESLALGNGLLVVPPGSRILPKGTRLEFHPFPGVVP